MAKGCTEFFYDDAVCERLAYFDEPSEFLLLGLSEAGHETLLRNLRVAADAAVSVVFQSEELFLTPPWSVPASAVSETDEDGDWKYDPRPTTQIHELTVNKARLSCFDLGGRNPLRRWAQRQIVGGYIDGNSDMTTSLPLHQYRRSGVVFVVDWGDLPSINETKDELLALMEKDLFGDIPIAVLLNNFDESPDDDLHMKYLEIAKQYIDRYVLYSRIPRYFLIHQN
ncbi:hypothetical protein B0J18DRAFT_452927 [Chaetomium sp. MPI-SDFR-AT-0129]|nr:hypothetical protein B0J18DRAFT_452927 [Chaetomium sp. MPI-SDFR-AT-0129]